MLFINLGAQHGRLEPEICAAFEQALGHGKHVPCRKVADFEGNLPNQFDADGCILHAKGTDPCLISALVQADRKNPNRERLDHVSSEQNRSGSHDQ